MYHIYKITSDPVVDFAAEELKKYSASPCVSSSQPESVHVFGSTVPSGRL